ncbi:hypothetical protein M899_2218 [Bacteriovorax sp. BSW11_IV]|uniref:hypothetical protein n=1 Tax=Bacteriovorax sp. BSW11_IV TaxID=1353529 RepID=UPI00038A18C4|nr:hypothetical protein [Bacteriovorax sp. BSW11_IV]EQC45176.1 hypothetical protein M899_2218 [Bacteriovorax sp. BSW11_IV]
MKTALVLVTTFLSLSSFAQTLFSQCYNYSYATDNVYEDRFNVTVKTNDEGFDALVEKKMWDLLLKDYVTVLETPKDIALGSSVEKKGNLRFVIKVNLSDYTRGENLIEVLNSLPSVMVSCRYKLN